MEKELHRQKTGYLTEIMFEFAKHDQEEKRQDCQVFEIHVHVISALSSLAEEAEQSDGMSP